MSKHAAVSKTRLDRCVQVEIDRGADTPDIFSTVPTRQLQELLRETTTLPIEQLVNTGAVHIDVERQRVFRDLYWKGSFAADTALGIEEQLRTAVLHPGVHKRGRIFAGGSFWKRFDRVVNGIATGEVVNYNIEWLPGDPEVRTVAYPDDRRRYFEKGQTVLLLRYRNHPYRLVYDTMKIIDANNAVGVMHIGRFPNGMEFATFVLARHNYPFELATEEDRALIAADPTALT